MVTVVLAAGVINILFRYSYLGRTPLESSCLGEQKYAISTSKHIRLENNSFRKGEIQRETAIARRA